MDFNTGTSGDTTESMMQGEVVNNHSHMCGTVALWGWEGEVHSDGGTQKRGSPPRRLSGAMWTKGQSEGRRKSVEEGGWCVLDLRAGSLTRMRSVVSQKIVHIWSLAQSS